MNIANYFSLYRVVFREYVVVPDNFLIIPKAFHVIFSLKLNNFPLGIFSLANLNSTTACFQDIKFNALVEKAFELDYNDITYFVNYFSWNVIVDILYNLECNIRIA